MIIPSGNPIQQIDDDTLDRAVMARDFAKQVLCLDASEGIVVGVLGDWGSGKTSFINLARPSLEEAGVVLVDFNPWMFSSTEQLVNSFFFELSAQLKAKQDLGELAVVIEEYGEFFEGLSQVPVIGWALHLISVGIKIYRRPKSRERGVDRLRANIKDKLEGIENKIVVVLDDVDRLTTIEIREIFKLVRLTANFPNFIYILAFDRLRVEEALQEGGVPGRAYLEKILQVFVDLPAIPPEMLRRQVLSAIEHSLAEIDSLVPPDQNSWPDVFMEIIFPLIKNMRDVRRYALTIRGTVEALHGQIELADLLALEAIRVFLPGVFRQLHVAIPALTASSNQHGSRDGAEPREALDRLIALSKQEGQEEVGRALIRRLFPVAKGHIDDMSPGHTWGHRWRLDRRVAHEDILRLYLERVAGEGFQAFTAAERALDLMTSEKKFDTYLRSLDRQRPEDVISSLESFEDQFRPEHSIPGTVVLLNLLPDLPKKSRGMFEFGTGVTVRRVVYRLLRALEQPEKVEKVVKTIMPKLHSLFSQLELISMVGHKEDRGHRLVSKEAAAQFEREWRARVRAAPEAALASESKLLWILLETQRDTQPGEQELVIPEAPSTTLAILKSACGEVRSQVDGSRVIEAFPRLHWDALVELFGDENVLRARIERVKKENFESVDKLLELVEKYLAGWKPDPYALG